jgi:hypothetical protein
MLMTMYELTTAATISWRLFNEPTLGSDIFLCGATASWFSIRLNIEVNKLAMSSTQQSVNQITVYRQWLPNIRRNNCLRALFVRASVKIVRPINASLTSRFNLT